MVIKVFTFCPRVEATAKTEFRTREIQFGDGYIQRAGDGINTKSTEWTLQFIGDWDYIKPILDFLDEHQGHTAFEWTNPMGELGLYVCKAYDPTAKGKNSAGKPMFQLNIPLEIAYHP
ncbi:phage tail protein [Yersinia massiliensis]|uniref:Phage tail protein n=1 Tax=Yersinia massiliensis TaxID=419257 RepID=A0ABM6USQ6_9GAMM|nr:phage tail protein [Yersinia massiliensis]AVX37917.1 phage tail protein [Yersinia massiliensis]QKJ13656.1 phage tail protein [Yersinia massiliensis]